MSKWSDEETDEPLIAAHRNFYKVEKWTKDLSDAVLSSTINHTSVTPACPN